ncbi:MAG: hypothetical protein L6Q97_24210, partial [Thermoanaerobaculia bacterium]|nr:hypothetical protein [Thermoanaerobaculia bacterium]
QTPESRPVLRRRQGLGESGLANEEVKWRIFPRAPAIVAVVGVLAIAVRLLIFRYCSILLGFRRGTRPAYPANSTSFRVNERIWLLGFCSCFL